MITLNLTKHLQFRQLDLKLKLEVYSNTLMLWLLIYLRYPYVIVSVVFVFMCSRILKGL